MKIKLNGKDIEIESGATLSDLISRKKLDESRVLASVNKEIIKTGTFSEIALAEGDEVELFSFVSGG